MQRKRAVAVFSNIGPASFSPSLSRERRVVMATGTIRKLLLERGFRFRANPA
ncbi:MAG TPA: hypothetical protein VGJ46_08615 [Candidatus Limnocylindrales bacterium]